MHHPIRIFVYGFIIILTMMIALALFAFHFNHNTDTSASQAVTNQLEKINLTQELYTVISSRTQFVQSMLLQPEGKLKQDEWQKYSQFEESYLAVRKRMTPLLSAKESDYMMKFDRLNKQISEYSQQLSVLFINGSRKEATQIFIGKILPRAEPQLKQLAKLVEKQRGDAEQALELANNSAKANRERFVIYAAFSIFISLIVAFLAVVFGQRLSRQLEELTNYLEDKVQERTESLLDTQKELLEDNNELARLASTDNLTGLFNRNHINEILANEHSRYQRHSHRFGIIMLDIDHFKPVNDNYGHDAGDLILKHLAKQLGAAVRSSDHVGRWGGEEFLICCTTIKPDDLLAIAENIRQTIARSKFEIVNKLTVSLGCAIIQPGETIDELIKRADVALYEAKNNGRNQSVISAMDA